MKAFVLAALLSNCNAKFPKRNMETYESNEFIALREQELSNQRFQLEREAEISEISSLSNIPFVELVQNLRKTVKSALQDEQSSLKQESVKTKGKTIKRMESVLANQITDMIGSEQTAEQLNEAQSKIEAVGSIQAPISELEKRLNIKFDQTDLDKKMVELKTHIEKKKSEAAAAADKKTKEIEAVQKKSQILLSQQKSKGKTKDLSNNDIENIHDSISSVLNKEEADEKRVEKNYKHQVKRENKLKKKNDELDRENKEAFEKGEGKQLDIQYETVRDIKDSLDNNKYIKNHNDDKERDQPSGDFADDKKKHHIGVKKHHRNSQLKSEKSAALARFEKEVDEKTAPAQVSEKQAEREKEEERESHLESLNIEGRKYNIDLDKESESGGKGDKLYDNEAHISEMTRDLKNKQKEKVQEAEKVEKVEKVEKSHKKEKKTATKKHGGHKHSHAHHAQKHGHHSSHHKKSHSHKKVHHTHKKHSSHAQRSHHHEEEIEDHTGLYGDHKGEYSKSEQHADREQAQENDDIDSRFKNAIKKADRSERRAKELTRQLEKKTDNKELKKKLSSYNNFSQSVSSLGGNVDELKYLAQRFDEIENDEQDENENDENLMFQEQEDKVWAESKEDVFDPLETI